jgi:hypothetical protein
LGPLLLPVVALGQLRFGFPVEKLAQPAEFGRVQLDGNGFAVLDRGSIRLACIVYGTIQRRFVEINVSNLAPVPLSLEANFVRIAEAGDSTVPVNTLSVASSIVQGATTPAVRPISPPPNVEPMITAMEASSRSSAMVFANHLAAFAHESQSILIGPGESRIYVFVFDQLSRKRSPFTVLVRVGDDSFRFPYRR